MNFHREIKSETEVGALFIPYTYKTYELNASKIRTPWTESFVQPVRMDQPHDRLRLARQNAGFEGPSDAARKLKLNPNTFTSNENGNRPISRKMAEVYGGKLGVSAGWLLYGEGEADRLSSFDVPLLSKVSAGMLKQREGVREADIERFIKVHDLPPGDWIALTVEGDSMNRLADDGAVIIVNRADDALVDGHFYIFALEDGHATFKRFRRTPEPMLVPYSTNLDHLAIPVGDRELYVFGRVRKVIIDL